ncbi:MAG: ABC transporter permease [Chloroflexi bacterium]|nr:ABC transporter permease [Chloroflexota bacterium]
MNLATFILRRSFLQVFVLFGVTLLTFFLMFIVPGDPAVMLVETGGFQPEVLERFRERWGFDRPAYKQYLTYMGNLVQGDFGVSLVTKVPVSKQLGRFLPATAELSIVALLMAVVMSIPAGIVAAVNRNRLTDQIVRIFSLFGVSMPIFWLAIILLLVFFFHLGWLPSAQRIALARDLPAHTTGFYLIDTLVEGDFSGFVSVVHHLLLPAFVLAFSVVGLLTRITRTSMLEVLGQEYIRTARAKGLSSRVVLYRHALKNALIPTVTILGLTVGALLSGAVLTETIFAWPGLGRFVVQSVLSLDRAAVVGVTLIVAVVYSMANLVVDVFIAIIDPRVTYD